MSIKSDHCKTCGKHWNELDESPWGTYLGEGKWGIQCKPCHSFEIEEQIRNFQESEPDTEYTDDVICPYCGHKHESDSEDSSFYTDGDHEFTCHHCSNEFSLTTNVTYTYSTEKKVNP